MGMQQLVQTLKGSLRQGLKHRQNLQKGYPQHYACGKERTDAEAFGYLWGQCITPIKQRTGAADINQNRHWNMELAIQHLSGLVLQPGEIFSFWHHMPQPTTRNGFRSGPMLIRGKLQTDVGGGLCQISTTLFGAFLQANCELLEHHNHSIDAHGSDRFFVLGQDAAVAYGYKDLMVRNANSPPLQVRLRLATNPMTVSASIWGLEPLSQRVRLTSQVIEPLPSPYPQGMPGCRVETQRWVAAESDLLAPPVSDAIWYLNYRFVSCYQPYATVCSNGTLASASA
jgi:vancomycin resistance protein VanW